MAGWRQGMPEKNVEYRMMNVGYRTIRQLIDASFAIHSLEICSFFFLNLQSPIIQLWRKISRHPNFGAAGSLPRLWIRPTTGDA